MKRFLTIFILAVLIVCTLSVCVSADSLYIKKIVSVVYDNSGSMTDGANGTSYDKQAYANYAMQTFCGLLNGEDQLFITYMNKKEYVDKGKGSGSSPETVSVGLSAGEIQKSITDIQSRASKGGTPWSAVDMAAKKLESIRDDNANTQYWLVIITDGEFNEVAEKSYDDQVAFLNEKLSQISLKTMPNGQAPRIVFFSINSEGGKKIPTPEESEVEGLTVYEAQSADGIAEQMAKIADKVSGRTRLTGSDIEKVKSDPNSVRVTSQFPLLNIVALAQNTAAKVKEIKVSSEVDTEIKRKVELQYVGADNQKYPTLKGTSCLIGLKDGAQKVIPAGSYTITFDGAVNDDLVILFEPALEMRTTFTVNGKTVTDYKELKELAEGDTISVSSKIYEMWTDNEISADKLPQGTEFKSEISINGTPVASSGKEMLIEDYVLTSDETVIEASVRMAGFAPIEYKTTVYPKKPSVYEVRAVSGTSTVNFDSISDGKFSVTFEIYRDNKRIVDPEAIKALYPKVTASPSGNGVEMKITNTGNIVVTPTSANENGGKDYTVTVRCDTDKGSGETSYKVVFSSYEVRAVNRNETLNFDKAKDNKDVSVRFEVYRDGKQITDPEAIRALNPKVTVSPEGNGGTTEIVDGKIVFTPNSARAESDGVDYTVTVSCNTDKGGAEAEYKVVFSKYEMKAVDKDVSIRHLDVPQNKDVRLTFEVYKDGERITNAAEIEALGVTVEAAPDGNTGETEITEDGKIVFTPTAVSGSFDGESFEVSVTCSAGKVSATGTYKVLCSSYEIVPIGTQESVKYEEVAQNKDFKLIFEYREDGAAITDRERIMALNPTVTTGLSGNGGTTTVDPDGRIVFTPNQAFTEDMTKDYYDVPVICRVGGAEKGSSYRVLIAKYDIFPANGSERVQNNKLYKNGVGVSFYVEKDGHRLSRDELGTVSVVLNEEWKALLTADPVIAPDGTITVTPYDDEKIDKGVFKWINFFDYLGYPREDVRVTLVTPFGKSEATVDVVPADIGYILLWVVLPALVDLLIVGFIIWWIIACIIRQRFAEGTVLYVAPIVYDEFAKGKKRSFAGVSRRMNLDSETKWFGSLGSFLYRLHPPIKLTIGEWSFLPGVRLPKITTDIARKVSIGYLEFSPQGSGVRVYGNGLLCDVTSLQVVYKDKGKDVNLVGPTPETLRKIVEEKSNRNESVYIDTANLSFTEKPRNSLGYYTLAPNRYYIVNAETRIVNKKPVITAGKFVYFGTSIQ